MEDSITKRTFAAAKWSTISEIAAKCITPITSMILARILAPEAFGVLATVTMVISFSEIFVEQGFQKYLIQHVFFTEDEANRYMSVAFWANLAISLGIWGIISAFNAQIAELVGNPGKGFLIVITGVTIPLYGIIGIQSCNLKKQLNFKKLFYVRIASSLVPLFITVPLAFLGCDYWSLIIGNIAGIVVQSLTLTAVKAFKPRLYFSWKCLKEMLSYGIWTILNGLATWLTSWIDAFLIGRFMSDYYLGLYKNTTGMMTSIFGIVTASIVPVLFSSLSKLQDDEAGFRKMYLNVQSFLCLFLLPTGMGLYFYRKFATGILLGSQWSEAADIIGITAITTVLRLIYVGLNGDVLRAKGEFKVPLILQMLDLVITIPLCYCSLKVGFWQFVYVRSLARLILIVPELHYMHKICKISPKDQWMTSRHMYAATVVMSIAAWLLTRHSHGFFASVGGILVCMAVYGAILLAFPEERKMALDMLHKTKGKSKHSFKKG